jgi:hypothetical protein
LEPVKRESPYAKLKRVAKKFADKVTHARKVVGFSYTVSDNATIGALYIKSAVTAASLLGWDTHVTVEGDKLVFTYVEELPNAPWEIR